MALPVAIVSSNRKMINSGWNGRKKDRDSKLRGLYARLTTVLKMVTPATSAKSVAFIVW
jgi:hypothetical protein